MSTLRLPRLAFLRKDKTRRAFSSRHRLPAPAHLLSRPCAPAPSSPCARGNPWPSNSPEFGLMSLGVAFTCSLPASTPSRRRRQRRLHLRPLALRVFRALTPRPWVSPVAIAPELPSSSARHLRTYQRHASSPS